MCDHVACHGSCTTFPFISCGGWAYQLVLQLPGLGIGRGLVCLQGHLLLEELCLIPTAWGQEAQFLALV